MCDIKLCSHTFTAGTLVKVNDNTEKEKTIVDGAYCHEYKVEIDGQDIELPGRYIKR